MTSLEKRLAKHFAPADIKAAREITPTRLSCPRVGQVRAIFKAESGETQEVFLELAAGRRGGMTLESSSTTQPGRAGRPCPLLAATLMEIDRRSLFSSIHDHTPVALDVIPADDFEESGEPAQDDEAEEPPLVPIRSQPVVARPASPAARRGAGRQPALATELDERRRLVEPAVRTAGLHIGDARRTAGALVFVLDIAASLDAHAVVVVPSRMQLDVTGQATGRPKPVIVGPEHVALDQLDQLERSLIARLVGTVAVSDTGSTAPLERRSIARIAISPQATATDLAMLCETGRLVVQPEPRRQPELVEPLAWDGSRPWEFALVLEPDDDGSLRAALEEDSALDDGVAPRRRPPAKATLRGMLVRGSQRKDIKEPRAILRSGLIVFPDRLARLSLPDSADTSPTAWMDQF